MRKLVNPAWVILLLVTGCFEGTEKKVAPRVLDANVGHRIPLETAERWIASLSKKSDRSRLLGSSVSTAQLQTVLGDASSKIGVVFHHSTDLLGGYHLLVTSLDQNLVLWNNFPVIDATTGLAISASTARTWSQRYNDNHPGEVWYHFFGINVFNDMTSNSLLNYVDIVPALNDQNEPQLILLAWNNLLSSTGGRLMEDDQPVAYDDSNRCPPCQCYE